MKNTKLLKRILIITASVAGGLIAVAVLLGVLNAVVADGKWTFGWNDYRYDETGYEIGSATVPYDTVTRIEIDWIDGMVTLQSCQDSYISITEQSEDELHESVKLRWRVSDNGKTLSIKYRKSSYYFNMSAEDRNKVLTVRIPETLLEKMEDIELSVVSSNIMLENIKAESFSLETVSGNFIAEECDMLAFSAETVSGAVVYNGTLHNSFEADSTSGSILLMGDICPAEVDIETVSADIKLCFPKDVSMTLDWETASGKLSSDIAMTQSGESYIAGGGTSRVNAESVSGNLNIKVKE
ncbi:MAG: DUF4097 family beta strand repeat protein [Clostridia bacterium]|nr:DUF4097 family beta strand repeat protein [Clostridia bacterium]